MDIGGLCTHTWRFGRTDQPVGGFGEREAFYDAYEAAGGRPVDRDLALAFEMHGSLRWGVMCMQMAAAHLSGEVASVERAAIGRRVSQTEADLLYMLKSGALLPCGSISQPPTSPQPPPLSSVGPRPHFPPP